MTRVWRAEPRECGAVTGLLVEFRDWWGYDVPSQESCLASVRRLIDDPDTEYLLAAKEEASAAAAVAQLRFRWSIWLAAEDCYLEDLFVREEARRSGLGRALVEAALARARERRCARVELDANEANAPALALYEGLGFSAHSRPAGGRNLLMRQRLRR